MASRQNDFYSGVYNNARAAGLSDAQARLAASQASLETGYGKSSVGNNYFGIKAGKSWNGPSVNAGTWEDGPGGAYNTRANFRSYSNPFGSLLDWSSQLGRNWPSSAKADTFDEAVDGLGNGVNGRYASDRNYESKLRSIDKNNYGPQLGIMSVIDPPTPQQRPNDAVNAFNAILAEPQEPSFPAASAPVQREALADVTPAAFNNSRFGAPAAFDNSRFGPAPTQTGYFDTTGLLAPDLPNQFDDTRFGAPAKVATTPQQLQRGLLDQQLDVGELPGLLGPATSWPGQVPTAATAYTDPRVTTEPASIKTARVQAPEQAPAVSSGLMSPQEAAQVQQQQGLLGGPMAHSSPAQLQAAAARNAQAMQRQSLLGGLGGGLLGGLVLGPVGAIGGGLLGKSLANRNYFPEAPEPAPKSKSTNDRSLNSYGRSVSNDSGQFRDAMSRGIGLY
jgi:hypothetical protein